ncbi:MAG: helix-turn-helix domain-containing protein, partial [Merismopedia sp. SIO2A8]|nr:helix-turn-helix domain-containing protein [Merismopedia sp. SIO2A8]
MFVGTAQAAELLGISTTRVRQLLKQGRIQGAYKVGRFWVIPLFDGMPVITKGSRGPKARWCRRLPLVIT